MTAPKPKMIPCTCGRFDKPHWRIKDAEGCRQPSTRPYQEAPRNATPLPSPPVPSNRSAWREPQGVLKCKNCGMLVTPEQLENCSRPICPSGPHGGFTDIENVTTSDVSWIKHAKQSRASKQKIDV